MSLKDSLPSSAERDVLGDGEIVEQREMLEHHADAARCALPTGPDSTICSPCQRISPALGWIRP